MKITFRTLSGCASDKARGDAAFDACFLQQETPELLEHLIQAAAGRFIHDLEQRAPTLSDTVKTRLNTVYCNAYLDWLPIALHQIRLRTSLHILVERGTHVSS